MKVSRAVVPLTVLALITPGAHPLAAADATGDPDAWIASVCATEPAPTPGLSNARRQGGCTAANSAQVYFAFYDMADDATFDLTRYDNANAAYAYAEDSTTTWLFVAVGAGGRDPVGALDALSPLEKFGFALQM